MEKWEINYWEIERYKNDLKKSMDELTSKSPLNDVELERYEQLNRFYSSLCKIQIFLIDTERTHLNRE